MSTTTPTLDVGRLSLPGQQRRGDDLFPVVHVCRDGERGLEPVCAWIAGQAPTLLEEARLHGALLFRGFDLRTAQDFDAFVASFGLPAFTYEGSLSNAVRINRTPRVFTANEAPSNVAIYFHHEMAQTPFYPSKLFFFCEQPAAEGGATPLCRSDWLLERLEAESPGFVGEVERKGLIYTNVMPGENDPRSGMGRSWQSTLGLSRGLAERRLAGLGYTWTWLDDGCLRVTTPVLPGVYVLPDGRRTFFNQVIAAYSGWKDTRNDPAKAITLGDGNRLDPEGVRTATALAETSAFEVPWQQGDVALVDNLVAMHGRRPFVGTRKILAAMV